MSPLCQLEMTLPGGFPGGVRGDGSFDERRGADAARGAAGCGSEAIDDGGCGAAAGARTPSGVPAIEGLPDRGSNRLNLEATRSSQQPAQAGAATESGAGDRPRVVLGFRTDVGVRRLPHASSISAVNQAPNPLRSQSRPGHRKTFFAVCIEMVLAPSKRPRLL